MPSTYHEMMKIKYLPFRMDRLTDSMVEKAAKELNETEEVRFQALEEMKELVLAETKLKCSTDDSYLLQFLRPRKFDVKKAFTLLQNKYNVKKAYAEIYDNCNYDDIRSLYRTGASCCLPYRDEDGCCVILFKMEKWNPNKDSIVAVLSGMTIMILRCIDDVATQVCGVRVIVDAKGGTFRQLRCLTPRYIQLFSKALRNSLPVRFKGIHIYNESTIFTYIWNVLKIFLTEKINQRVHFHGENQKNLHKFIPKAILSSEYGGENLHLDAVDWCEKEIEPFFEKFTAMLENGYQS